MKLKDFNKIIDNTLFNEAQKIIKENVDNDVFNGFQTLYSLKDNITDVNINKNDQFNGSFVINNISEEDFIKCCGGETIEDAERNFIEGLHKDLEENGYGKNFDIDVEIISENNKIKLIVKIMANKENLFGESETKEFVKKLQEARNKKQKKFVFENEEYDVDECWDEMEEEEEQDPFIDEKKEILLGDDQINENKKIVKLSESEMKKLLKKIISEAIPGIDKQTSTFKDSGKINSDYIKEVKKKIDDYLNFDGNDNPEFPNQIGGEKMARKNTEEQDQIVDDNRGRGPQDLEYDTDGIDNNEISKKFQERIEMYLNGDTKTGNSQEAAGVIKTKTGENMLKNIKRRQDNLRKEPIYSKEPVPVKTKADKEPVRTINEVKKEIERMISISKHNKPSQ